MSCIDGGFLQVGETGFIPSSKILVIKTDNAGDLLWSKEIGHLKSNLGNAVIESDDAYLVVGALAENSAIIKLEKSSGLNYNFRFNRKLDKQEIKYISSLHNF